MYFVTNVCPWSCRRPSRPGPHLPSGSRSRRSTRPRGRCRTPRRRQTRCLRRRLLADTENGDQWVGHEETKKGGWLRHTPPATGEAGHRRECDRELPRFAAQAEMQHARPGRGAQRLDRVAPHARQHARRGVTDRPEPPAAARTGDPTGRQIGSTTPASTIVASIREGSSTRARARLSHTAVQPGRGNSRCDPYHAPEPGAKGSTAHITTLRVAGAPFITIQRSLNRRQPRTTDTRRHLTFIRLRAHDL